MAYFGVTPSNVFGQGTKDSFNGDGSTTAFTLSRSVLLATDIEVFVGNVRQEPNVAYTVSGTTLTFTGTPASGTGNIYAVHQTANQGTLVPPTGTALAPTTLTATGDISGSTLNATGDTSAGDNAAIGFTSTEGLILTGQGSTNDVTIKNDADADVIEIPTGTTNVNLAGNTTVGGTLAVTGASTLTGTVTANGDMVLGGTTPTLTIGDAGAEDAKIVFDGNAQDYHIGLDDSADTLTIGKGSTLGTTTSMAFDANGIITKPLQPAFLAQSANNDQTNLTLNASTAVAFGTEIFDNNSDFTPSTGDGQGGDGSNVKAVFTAPVTGKYHLNFNIRLDNLDTVTQFTMILLITSNRTLQFIHGHGGYAADVNYMSIQGTHLVDMDAGDTVSLSVNLPSLGTAQMDINSNTSFSGYLVA